MRTMRTIVSVTPLKVQEDSRTFKAAASFARFGYRSIVVEGQASDLHKADLPFGLISVGGRRSGSKSARLDHSQPTEETKSMWLIIGAISGSVSKSVKGVVMSIYRLLTGPLSNKLWIGYFEFPIFVLGVMYMMYEHLFRPLRYFPKASLYYLHAPLNFPAIYLLCKRYRVPFIYDAHDFYSGIEGKENRTLFYRKWVDPLLLRLERSCIKHAAAVVTVCEGVAHLQEETFKCRPVVVRNCHDARLDRTPPVHLRQSLGLSSDDFLIVTIGQAKIGQAIQESLDAMQKLPGNVHLALVGKNTDQHHNIIRERELEGRVHTVSHVMPFEVVPFIQSADASLILYYARSPNYQNCLPNGFFQSIAAELPLLYPELPEINRIARQYSLGIPINSLDPESIRSGVIQLMADSKQFSKSLRVAKEELSWEREEIILRELLSRVLDREGCEA